MITEDYVSFETAKLLKEKEFPQEYDRYHSMVYNEEDYKDEYEVQRMVLETRLVKAGTLSSYPIGVPEPKCYCPTLQMAMRWLREVHHIVLVVDYDYECTDKSYCYKVYCLGENGKPERVPIYGIRYDIEGNQHRDLVSYRDYKRSFSEYAKYEEACEAAIKYCLENLI